MRTLNIPFPQQQIISSPPTGNLPSVFYDRFDLTNYRRYLDGIAKARNSSIVFAGCIRDVNPVIFGSNLGKIFNVGSKFKNFQVVLVENDSIPICQEHLSTLKGNDKITVLSHKYGFPKLGDGRDERRVSIMAMLRNQYLQYIKTNLSKYNYVCVIDMDLTDWRQDGVFNSLGYQHWDMIGANGIQIKKDGSLTYYDTFAVIEANGKTYQTQEFKDTPILNSRREHVMACFGGIGLYKTSSFLKGGSYDLYKLDDKYCSEQCGIHINMARSGCGNISINPNMVVIR